jgi:exopolysaccharide biosynthesis WecB/TagA/CpsF family protein
MIENASLTDLENAELDELILDRREAARTKEFLGVEFAQLNPQTLYNRVVEEGYRAPDFKYLVTPNVDHLVRLNSDPSMQQYYDEAWLNVSDSRILEIFANLSNIELPACPGSDLTAQIFENSLSSDDLIVIIGADEEIVQIIAEKYGLNNIKHYMPPMGLKNKPDEIILAAEFIKSNPARFHFICVGSPQQEMVALAAKKIGGAIGIGLCVGASLDFLAGHARRAPLWMQKLRLEWMHRLLSEPKRMWKRYLVDGPRILGIWLRWKTIQKRLLTDN